MASNAFSNFCIQLIFWLTPTSQNMFHLLTNASGVDPVASLMQKDSRDKLRLILYDNLIQKLKNKLFNHAEGSISGYVGTKAL